MPLMHKITEKMSRINTVANYRKMWQYVRPYKGRALLAILLTIPVGSMDAVIAWVLRPYTDIVMVEKNVRASSLIPLLIILFSLAQGLLNYAVTYLNAWVGQRITLDLKYNLFRKMMRAESGFFDKSTSGMIQMRFNGDADMACNGLLNNLKLFTTRVFSSISLIFVLFYNSWQLALIAVVVLFGALVPLSRVRRRIKGIVKKTIVTSSAISTHYNEAFGGNRVIASYNLYDIQAKKFKETLHATFKLGMKMIRKTSILGPAMHFVIACGIAGVIWLGGYLIVNDQLTPGGFVSFIVALLMLYQPIKSVGSNFTNLQTAIMAMERVFEMLERIPAIKNRPQTRKLAQVQKSIAYKNVTFEYLSGRPVLKNVSLDIKVGQMIALVGNSGGGKTTFVNLLPRFYDVTRGAIEIDGTDIRDFDIESLRSKIAVVFQDNFLFAGTIRDNIVLGDATLSQSKIDKAVEGACLSEFVQSLDNGLDAEIGERGVLLSGGQKQRIAIARAFIKDAPIVILDEATSALDNKSEAVVQKAINNLMAHRTVFVIAHRLSTVRNADKIVVINNGEIVESGTHDELVNNPDSAYAGLYKTQLK